jgi:hypothetical protein
MTELTVQPQRPKLERKESINLAKIFYEHTKHFNLTLGRPLVVFAKYPSTAK